MFLFLWVKKINGRAIKVFFLLGCNQSIRLLSYWAACTTLLALIQAEVISYEAAAKRRFEHKIEDEPEK